MITRRARHRNRGKLADKKKRALKFIRDTISAVLDEFKNQDTTASVMAEIKEAVSGAISTYSLDDSHYFKIGEIKVKGTVVYVQITPLLPVPTEAAHDIS